MVTEMASGTPLFAGSRAGRRFVAAPHSCFPVAAGGPGAEGEKQRKTNGQAATILTYRPFSREVVESVLQCWSSFSRRKKSETPSGLATLEDAFLALRPVDKLILSRVVRIFGLMGFRRHFGSSGPSPKRGLLRPLLPLLPLLRPPLPLPRRRSCLHPW